MALWAPWGLSPVLVIIINKNVVWNSFQHPKSLSKTSLKSSNLLVTCSPYPYGLLVASLFIDSNVRPSLIFWAILLAFGPHELLFSRFSCSFEALQVGPFRLLLEICLLNPLMTVVSMLLPMLLSVAFWFHGFNFYLLGPSVSKRFLVALQAKSKPYAPFSGTFGPVGDLADPLVPGEGSKIQRWVTYM